jgi:hypothetical protein
VEIVTKNNADLQVTVIPYTKLNQEHSSLKHIIKVLKFSSWKGGIEDEESLESH